MKRSPVRCLEWLFRNRRTGAITVVQVPNIPLWVFLCVSVLLSAFDPGGIAETLLKGAATTAILIWAADELVRGVNPWRRALGAVVMLSQLARLIA